MELLLKERIEVNGVNLFNMSTYDLKRLYITICDSNLDSNISSCSLFNLVALRLVNFLGKSSQYELTQHGVVIKRVPILTGSDKGDIKNLFPIQRYGNIISSLQQSDSILPSIVGATCCSSIANQCKEGIRQKTIELGVNQFPKYLSHVNDYIRRGYNSMGVLGKRRKVESHGYLHEHLNEPNGESDDRIDNRSDDGSDDEALTSCYEETPFAFTKCEPGKYSQTFDCQLDEFYFSMCNQDLGDKYFFHSAKECDNIDDSHQNIDQYVFSECN